MDWRNIKINFDTVGVTYEDWDLPTLKTKIPIGDFRLFHPPRRPDDPDFYAGPTELIDRVENGYDHDARPLQYALPHLGITVDTGVFHRNREINKDSSFSVMG